MKGHDQVVHINKIRLKNNISLNMKTMKKYNSNKDAIILAGLPEQVLRQIFRYIGTYELFHTVRKLNQRVKKLVDEYLCLQGIFMLIRGKNNRYIYIFKREGKYFKTFSIRAPPFPISDPFPRRFQGSKEDEGGSTHFELSDNNYNHYYNFSLTTSFTEIQEPCIFGLYWRTPFFRLTRIELNLYKFEVESCRWKILKTRADQINNELVASFPISDSTILRFESIRDERSRWVSLCMDKVSASSLKECQGYGENCLDIPDYIQRMKQFAIVNLTKTSIILIGGYYYNEVSEYPVTNISAWLIRNKVFLQGTFEDDYRKITWDAIDIGGYWTSNKPICFKLKDNIYITGNRTHYCSSNPHHASSLVCPYCVTAHKSCDKYDYKEKKIYLNMYSMPYALSADSFLTIATDKDEHLAILLFTFEGKEKMLIFTESDGFVDATDYQHSVKLREIWGSHLENSPALLWITS